jgi:choline dehydrogenase-like flavoprotein
MVDFDYVIVGAGAAGCVLASRLSEDPGNQVLLLEYGGSDTNPLLYARRGSISPCGGTTTPITTRPGRSVPAARSRRGCAARSWAGRPRSTATTTSSVHLSGVLPGNPPVITARFLDDDADRQATAPVLGIARQLFGKGPLADLVLDEDFPGPAVSSPDEVVRYALDTGAGIYHAVGAMGPDASDVVDPQLRVRGVTRLRVVDASVLPVQVAGNTQAPRWRSPGSPPASSAKTYK